MKDSTVTVEKQKTPLGGYPEEVWLETRGNLEVQTGEAASKNGNDDVQLIYTSNLLDWVLERGNVTRAYKQVVRNKGSHGIDKMKVDQLKPYVKENWEQIKKPTDGGKLQTASG